MLRNNDNHKQGHIVHRPGEDLLVVGDTGEDEVDIKVGKTGVVPDLGRDLLSTTNTVIQVFLPVRLYTSPILEFKDRRELSHPSFLSLHT